MIFRERRGGGTACHRCNATHAKSGYVKFHHETYLARNVPPPALPICNNKNISLRDNVILDGAFQEPHALLTCVVVPASLVQHFSPSGKESQNASISSES